LIGKNTVFDKQPSYGIHALPTTADNTPLTSRCAACCALWLTGFVNQRGVETADAGSDYPSIGLADLNDSPSAGCNPKINSQNTPIKTRRHHAT